MPDVEKVIKEFEHLLNAARGNYQDFVDLTVDGGDEILALLKEQEPVAPVLVGRMWECGKCHAPVGIFMDDRRDLFCRTCGRRVKWDA